jgi:hypothetical protein
MGRFCNRLYGARNHGECAIRAAGAADSTGISTRRHRNIGPAPQGPGDTAAGLPDLPSATRWRVSPVFSWAQCRSRLQRDLRAGIPPERNGDRAAYELLLAPRLGQALPRRTDQCGADHQRGRPVDDDGHRQVSDTARGAERVRAIRLRPGDPAPQAGFCRGPFMTRWIAAALLAVPLALAGTAVNAAGAAPLQAAASQQTPDTSDLSTPRRARHHHRHASRRYHRPYQPYYLDRPDYYAPAPFVPFNFGYGIWPWR